GVQMGREIGGDLLVGDLHRAEVHLRAVAEIELELVAVTQLDEPAGIGLGRTQEGPAGAERGDAHLVRRELLGAREVTVAIGMHGSLVRAAIFSKQRRGDFDSYLMLICNNLLLKPDHAAGGPWLTCSADTAI